MKKIVGFIAVFLVFSWVTTANATPIATITNSNGVLAISGFHDLDPTTMDFAFNFNDTNLNGTPFGNGDSGIVTVFEAINSGQIYSVNADFTIDALGRTFNTTFDILSQNNVAAGVPASLDDVLGPNVGFFKNGALGTISVDVSGKPVTLNLTSIKVGGSSTDPILTLGTKEIDPNLNLSKYLNCLDGWANPNTCDGQSQPGDPGYRNGSVTSGFTNANLTVPEPATLLLLGVGLFGMLGFSKRRA